MDTDIKTDTFCGVPSYAEFFKVKKHQRQENSQMYPNTKSKEAWHSRANHEGLVIDVGCKEDEPFAKEELSISDEKRIDMMVMEYKNKFKKLFM